MFASHAKYRELYHPLTGEAGTTFMLEYPTSAQPTVRFLEGILYNTTGQEDFLLRQAAKNYNTVEEVLSWKPWSESIAAIRQEMPGGSKVPPDPPKHVQSPGKTQTEVNAPPEEQTAQDSDVDPAMRKQHPE